MLRIKPRIGAGRIALPIILALAAVLGGCQSEPTTAVLAANDYRLRHPIVLAERNETLDLPVGTNMRKLSPEMAAAVTSFGHDAIKRGDGTVEVIVPSGAANDGAVHAITPQIRKALQNGGVNRGRIVTRTYPVDDPTAAAPVRLAYLTMAANVASCGQWPDNIAGNFANTNFENFGCATQYNLAASVENPADLIYPRATTPADRQRRGVVFEKYRKGEQTAAEYKEGDGAKISDAAD